MQMVNTHAHKQTCYARQIVKHKLILNLSPFLFTWPLPSEWKRPLSLSLSLLLIFLYFFLTGPSKIISNRCRVISIHVLVSGLDSAKLDAVLTFTDETEMFSKRWSSVPLIFAADNIHNLVSSHIVQLRNHCQPNINNQLDSNPDLFVINPIQFLFLLRKCVDVIDSVNRPLCVAVVLERSQNV